MLVVETIARVRRDHLGRGVPINQMARDLKLWVRIPIQRAIGVE